MMRTPEVLLVRIYRSLPPSLDCLNQKVWIRLYLDEHGLPLPDDPRWDAQLASPGETGASR